jgi:pimeloyl-ACP methyl ester carboxylesterase
MTSTSLRDRRSPVRRLLPLLTATLLLPVPAVLGGPAAAATTSPPATAATGPTLPTYDVIDLGRAPVPTWGGSHGQPDAISDNGHIVGIYTDDQGFYYGWGWKDGSRSDRGKMASLVDVNSGGVAVGMNYHDTPYGRTRQAWLSGPSGGGFLPFHDEQGESRATGINDAGVVVGWSTSETNDGDETPVMWAGGRSSELPKLPGQISGEALSVNNAGTILGDVRTRKADGDVEDFTVLWQDGAVRALPGMVDSVDLSSNGIVLGYSYDGSRTQLSRWKDGAIEVLQGLPGQWYNTAVAINSSGDVLGESGGEDVIWPGGSTTPVRLAGSFESWGAQVGYFTDINDAGWITGSSATADSYIPVVLRPGAQPPTLGELSVEQRAVPSNEWVDVPAEGTVDGNTVRVAATVTNRESTPKEVKLFVSVDDQLLTQTPLTATVPAKGTATITHEWDTTGKAWQHSAPAPDRTFEVRLMADNQEAGTKTVDLKVRPRPLVLVHGFNATAGTWSAYPGIVAGVRQDWGVYAVGDGKAPGTMNTGSLTSPTAIPRTIVDNAETMAGYVAGVRDQLDAQQVDVVAHSMGGLISRQYVESFMGKNVEGENVANQLVMLGTPNQGSPCASLLPLAGMYELRPEVVAAYNARMTNRPGVPMSVLAGNALPFTCDQRGPGDGVVAVPSAITGYPDNAQVGRVHTAITGAVDFEGFVLPRLIRGAGGGSPTALRSLSTATTAIPSPQLLGTRTATVSSAAPVDLPVDVGTAGAFGVSLVAPPHVTARLVAPAARPPRRRPPPASPSPRRASTPRPSAGGRCASRARRRPPPRCRCRCG